MSHDKLSEAAAELGKHLDELLFVDKGGECTCYNEGTCEWCRTHCLQCGATADQHPVQERGEAPHTFQALCQCVGDVLCVHCMGVCTVCGGRSDAHPVTQNNVDDWRLNCEAHDFMPPDE